MKSVEEWKNGKMEGKTWGGGGVLSSRVWLWLVRRHFHTAIPPYRHTKIIACLLLIGQIISTFGQETPQEDLKSYLLDAEDKIKVTVLRHTEFSGEFEIPPNGKVTFPAVGELDVRGLTTAQLADRLAERLKTRLRAPEVYVSLVAARPLRVFVEGKVNQPGAYPIRPDWHVFEAIAAAGGLKVTPERAQAFLMRGEEVMTLDLLAIYHRGDVQANLVLKPGDKISVQERQTIRVFVNGPVKNPGQYDLEVGARVDQAVTTAGGYTDSAALSKAFIVRANEAIPVDLYRLMILGDLTANVTLQDYDRLFVPANIQRCAVLGEVGKPGYLVIPDGKPFHLADAIALAGGPTKRAITSRVYLLRLEGNEVKKMEVPFLKFQKSADVSANPPIKDGDVIVLTETKRFDAAQIFQAFSSIGVLFGAGIF